MYLLSRRRSFHSSLFLIPSSPFFYLLSSLFPLIPPSSPHLSSPLTLPLSTYLLSSHLSPLPSASPNPSPSSSYVLFSSLFSSAISHAMARDGSSGGVIRLVTIDQSGCEKQVVLGKPFYSVTGRDMMLCCVVWCV